MVSRIVQFSNGNFKSQIFIKGNAQVFIYFCKIYIFTSILNLYVDHLFLVFLKCMIFVLDWLIVSCHFVHHVTALSRSVCIIHSFSAMITISSAYSSALVLYVPTFMPWPVQSSSLTRACNQTTHNSHQLQAPV